MTALNTYLTLAAAIGSGLVGGIFFAFSTFVMRALGQMAPASGIEAMQRINVTVLNPWFLGAFFGTALVGLWLGGWSVWHWDRPGAVLLLAGSVLYVIGTFGVTVAFNVPLNEALAKLPADSAEAARLWARYLVVWTNWNHVRTIAALLGAAALVWGLRQSA